MLTSGLAPRLKLLLNASVNASMDILSLCYKQLPTKFFTLQKIGGAPPPKKTPNPNIKIATPKTP